MSKDPKEIERLRKRVSDVVHKACRILNEEIGEDRGKIDFIVIGAFHGDKHFEWTDVGISFDHELVLEAPQKSLDRYEKFGIRVFCPPQ